VLIAETPRLGDRAPRLWTALTPRSPTRSDAGQGRSAPTAASPHHDLRGCDPKTHPAHQPTPAPDDTPISKRSGLSNEMTTNYATISGGKENKATGEGSSVSGGGGGEASGVLASVTGGRLGKAPYFASTLVGGLEEVTEKEFGVTTRHRLGQAPHRRAPSRLGSRPGACAARPDRSAALT